MRCDEKGISLRLSLLSFILLTCCQYRSRRESYSFCGFLSCVYCVLVTYSLHRKNKITTTKWYRSRLFQKKRILLYARFRWFGIVQSLTILMTDYEEASDDFPTENSNKTAEATVGSFRAQSTDEWTAASGITTKIPPLFDGLTSWFKYEELIEDWLDRTVLEVSKRGPALKNWLVGVAERKVWRTSQSRFSGSGWWSLVFSGCVETPRARLFGQMRRAWFRCWPSRMSRRTIKNKIIHIWRNPM